MKTRKISIVTEKAHLMIPHIALIFYYIEYVNNYYLRNSEVVNI